MGVIRIASEDTQDFVIGMDMGFHLPSARPISGAGEMIVRVKPVGVQEKRCLFDNIIIQPQYRADISRLVFRFEFRVLDVLFRLGNKVLPVFRFFTNGLFLSIQMIIINI